MRGHAEPAPIPVVVIVLMLTLTVAAVCHGIYAKRSRPAVREFLDGIRPLLRTPFDEAFLIAALLADLAFLGGIYLLLTGRR